MPAAAQMRPQPGMPGAGPQGPRPGYKYTTAVRNPAAQGAVPQGAQMQQVWFHVFSNFNSGCSTCIITCLYKLLANMHYFCF